MGKLHIAAKKGDLEAVKKLLEPRRGILRILGRKRNVDAVVDERTPLILAAEHGHVEVVTLLLDSGADPNITTPLGSALHMAAFRGETDLVKLLVDHGADVSLTIGTGETPLHTAGTFAWLEVAEFLLASGADVNAPDSNGQTPLHCAANSCMPERAPHLVVAAMARHGGDLNAKDNRGKTPLQLARTREIAAVLVIGVSTPATDSTKLAELILVLGDRERGIERMTAISELAAMGESAVPALINCLYDSRPRARSDAALALGMMGSVASAAVPALTKLKHDGNPAVEIAAGQALSQIQG